MKFSDRGTEDIYDGTDSKAARRTLPSPLHRTATDLLDYLAAAVSLNELATLPGTRLEKLAGDRVGQHSIRINRQYRICFRWTKSGATEVEIADYH